MIYEILDAQGNVINTIIADAAFMAAAYPGSNYRELPDDFPAPEPRHISVGSFFDRFGSEKINILASTDPVVQALVRDASVRKFIDLDRLDLAQAMQLLVSKGFAIDPDAILNAPVQANERP